MDIKVISSNKDGAELKGELKGYYSYCKGKKDDDTINEALEFSSKGRTWILPKGAWERIFGDE